MRKDKEFIFTLRREGRSYRYIQEATGVSRGTLCGWFKDQEWSKHITGRHTSQSTERSKDRMIKMNMVRKLKLQYRYALVEKEAEKEYHLYRKDTLFWAGLMLYAGEGDKNMPRVIRMNNSDFYVHKIFIQFSLQYLDIKRDNLRYALVVYSDNDIDLCLKTWSEELGMPINLFYKPHVVKEKQSTKRLQYGTCISIISSTANKKKLLKWLSLAKKEQFKDAVMV